MISKNTLSVIFCSFLISVDCRGGHAGGHGHGGHGHGGHGHGGHGHGGHGHSSFGGSHTSSHSHTGHSYPSSSGLSGSGPSLTSSHTYPSSAGLSGSGSSSITSFSQPSLGYSGSGSSLYSHSYPSSAGLSGSGSSNIPSSSYQSSSGLSDFGTGSSYKYKPQSSWYPGHRSSSNSYLPPSIGLSSSDYVPSSSYPLLAGIPDFDLGSSSDYKLPSSWYPDHGSSSLSNSFVPPSIGWSSRDYNPSIPDLSGIPKSLISDSNTFEELQKSLNYLKNWDSHLNSDTTKILNDISEFKRKEATQTEKNIQVNLSTEEPNVTTRNFIDEDKTESPERGQLSTESYSTPSGQVPTAKVQDPEIPSKEIEDIKLNENSENIQQTSGKLNSEYEKEYKHYIAMIVDMFKKSKLYILSSNDYIKPFLNGFDPKYWPEEYKTTSTTTVKTWIWEPSTTYGYNYHVRYNTESPEAGQLSTESYSTPSWQEPSTDRIQDPELPSKESLRTLLSKPPWWVSIFIAV